MASLSEGQPGKNFNVSLCFEKLSLKTERHYKDKILNEILKMICALFNSNGGKINVVQECGNISPRQRMYNFVRMVEQRILEFTDLGTLATNISFSYSFHLQIVIDISIDDRQPFTLNYNLYLPSQTQVLSLQGSEVLAKVREVVLGKIVVEETVRLGSHQKKFVQFEHTPLQQSKVVQLKNLKASATKCVTLADRIVGKSNKFSNYVSAFANHRGGHIYYGINDDGKIEGEKIANGSKNEVIRKVRKTIDKMVFSKHCNRPEKGHHWEIFFEPVEDTNGDPIPSTFVIVIYVASSPGGVFAEEPESYHVVEGEVTKMPFDSWLARLTQPLALWQSTPTPRPIHSVSWSSHRSRIFFQKLTTKLMQLRNQGNIRAFEALSCLAKKKFPKSDASLIVQAEEIVTACKQHCLEKATTLQQNFTKSFKSSKDSLFYEVRSLHLQSMIARGERKYKKSYDLAQDGLQKMQLIYPGFNTVWFYIHAAMVANVFSNEERDSEKSRALKQEARQYLEFAERDVSSLEDSLEELLDIRQKLYIYKAFVSLDCPVTGETPKPQPETPDTIKAATKELASVCRNDLMANPLTPYRKMQYLLAQSDLLCRRTEARGGNRNLNAKRAFELITESLILAKELNFQDMVEYATKRRANLTEDLIRNHSTSKKEKSASFDSLGFLNFF